MFISFVIINHQVWLLYLIVIVIIYSFLMFPRFFFFNHIQSVNRWRLSASKQFSKTLQTQSKRNDRGTTSKTLGETFENKFSRKHRIKIVSSRKSTYPSTHFNTEKSLKFVCIFQEQKQFALQHKFRDCVCARGTIRVFFYPKFINLKFKNPYRISKVFSSAWKTFYKVQFLVSRLCNVFKRKRT